MADIKPGPAPTDDQSMDMATTSVNAATTMSAWVRALRPKQWLKNLLVFAAPGAAGAITEATTLTRAAVAFVVFSLAASAMYLVNDVADAERDLLHPIKRFRPIASGAISKQAAIGAAVVLGAVAGALLVALGSPATSGVLGAYVFITVGYSYGLKHVPIVDILIVASGFVLRAIAGATATDLPISSWFLIVTSAGALFVVTGKRLAELLDGEADGTRPSLDGYTEDFTKFVLAVASGVAVVAYCLWAFESDPSGAERAFMAVSAVPFVGSLLRYAMILFSGGGAEPEEVFLNDRVIQGLGVAWLVLFGAGLVVS